jgi:hypothetical protein
MRPFHQYERDYVCPQGSLAAALAQSWRGCPTMLRHLAAAEIAEMEAQELANDTARQVSRSKSMSPDITPTAGHPRVAMPEMMACLGYEDQITSGR